MAEAKAESKDTVYPDTDDSDDDVKDMDFQPRVMSKARGGRKCSVMSAPVRVDSDWRPPVFPKSRAEKDVLRQRVTRNVLMKHLSPKEVDTLVDAFESLSFENDEEIIRQGGEGDKFYVIEEGQCDISIEGTGKVAEIDGGAGRDYFGELALLYNAPRAATVVSTTPCKAWALDRTTFKTILQDSATKQSQMFRGFLDRVPLLSGLSAFEKLQLADALKAKTFERDEVIIREGEEGHEFFIVEEGQVICTKRTSEGHEIEVSDPLGPGSYFGELALLNDDMRAATVRALTETRCVTVDRATFMRILGPLREILKQNEEMYQKYCAEADADAK